MTRARERGREEQERRARAAYTLDMEQAPLQGHDVDTRFAAIQLDRLEVVPLDRRQARCVLGMSREQFDKESANGEVAIQTPWMAIDVGLSHLSMVR